MAPTSARPWGAGRSPTGLPRQWCALRRSLFFQGGPALLPPSCNGRLVALRRPCDRPLDTVVQPMQQPVDVGGMVRDAEGAPHHLGDALAGPHLPAKPIRLRSTVEQVGKLGELLGAEFGCRPRRGTAS